MTDPRGTRDRTFAEDVIPVRDFARDMLDKLRDNAHKAHWNTVSQDWLLDRLRQEVVELQEELTHGNGRSVISECADVANFAMMIADNAREQDE